MAIFAFFSAVASLIRGKDRDCSVPPSVAEEPSKWDEYTSCQSVRNSVNATLTFQCHSTCSEVDFLIAQVIAIGLENEEVADVLPSIEKAEDYVVADDHVATTYKAEENCWQRPKVQKINGLDIEGKYISQIGQARHLCSLGWSIESILVYLKLARRGYEPLFSTAWKMDFPKFPCILFTNDDDAVFIKSCGKSLSHGSLDFDKFCGLGRDIRSAERRKLNGQDTPGKLTTIANRAIQKYIKATWKDAGILDAIIEGRLPELVIMVIKPNASSDELSELAEQKLHLRARELLKVLRSTGGSTSEFIINPPIIFGIVAYDAVVGVMACEPLSPGMEIRKIGFYHFNKQHEEVWNCISLAILVYWARNSMLWIKDALGICLERTRSVEDPDF